MYIYGKNVAREKLSTNEKINKAIVSNKFRDLELLGELKKKKVKIQYFESKYLDKMVDGLHQGIILEIDDVKSYTIDEYLDITKEKKNPLVVILDHLEDPHNFGAIIRTSEALGVDGIIIPNDRSVNITSTVVKTSVGAINYIPIVRVANLYSTIEKLKKNGYWIVGTDMEGEDYNGLDYNMPLGLVIGNEGHGISKIVRDNCDFIASIPMSGKINSLNASVSCGIILSKIVSSRSYE